MDTGLPVPDAIPPLEKLQEDLVLDLVQEVKFQPDLHQLPTTTQVRMTVLCGGNGRNFISSTNKYYWLCMSFICYVILIHFDTIRF